MTIALVTNIGLIIVALACALVLTAPDVPVLTVSVILAVVSIVVPITTWPLSHTVWTAIDLHFRPMDEAEVAQAAQWLATH